MFRRARSPRLLGLSAGKRNGVVLEAELVLQLGECGVGVRDGTFSSVTLLQLGGQRGSRGAERREQLVALAQDVVRHHVVVHLLQGERDAGGRKCRLGDGRLAALKAGLERAGTQRLQDVAVEQEGRTARRARELEFREVDLLDVRIHTRGTRARRGRAGARRRVLRLGGRAIRSRAGRTAGGRAEGEGTHESDEQRRATRGTARHLHKTTSVEGDGHWRAFASQTLCHKAL
jgi:hypothetical protein